MATAPTVPLSLCPGRAPSRLPAQAAVLGPCSPAAALHLALGFLDDAALPPFVPFSVSTPFRLFLPPGLS